jgi:hypothetical protein
LKEKVLVSYQRLVHVLRFSESKVKKEFFLLQAFFRLFSGGVAMVFFVF